MVNKSELIVVTEKNVVYFPLERGHVMRNDTGRNLLVRQVIVVFPCGEICRSNFDDLPYMGSVSIKDFKPVIKSCAPEKDSCALSEMIGANSGFILPICEVLKIFSGRLVNWCLTAGMLRNESLHIEVPSDMMEHLKRLPEVKNALEREAMKAKASLN